MINRKKSVIFIPYIIISILYFLFHMKYMPEYIDDTWVLSWAYRFVKHNDVTDYVFGLVNTRGSILFGTGYSFFYGHILNLIGWSRSNAVIISTFFIWLTSFIWHRIVLKLGYTKKVAHLVSILMLVMEIFFALGNKLRSDSMTLCLISFAFYLFISRHYLLAGFISIVAFEIHAISLTYFFYILAYLVSILDDMKKRPAYYVKGALIFILGVLIGCIYYYLIQKDYIKYFFETTTGEMAGHAFYAYFWKMKFAWRHIPEIFIILIAIIVSIKNKVYKKDKFLFPFFIMCVLSSFVLRRGNYHYVAFIYPSVILLIASAVCSLNRVRLFGLLLGLYLLPQYGYLFFQNYKYDQKEYEKKILESVPDDDKFILGNSGAWFPLKEREFHEYGYFNRGACGNTELPETLYLISTKRYRDNINGHKEYNDKLFESYNISEINRFETYNEEIVKIYLLNNKE